MTEREDYLWDPGAEPDREIEALERRLARYRHVPEPLAAPRRGARRRTLVLVALATLAASALVVLRLARDPVRGYRVSGLAAATIVREGDAIATGPTERARVLIADVGAVDVEPGARLFVEHCGEEWHRLRLERGRVSASIVAEPRRFQIDTPAGRAVDLGCAYELSVDDDGRSVLRVTDGQVAFELDGRDVYVPAGAVTVSVPGRGPQAPVFEASSPRFHAAVEALEFEHDPDPAAIADLVAAAEYEDTLTVWHLFADARTAPALRDACYAMLARRFPRPAGVTEAGLLARDAAMGAAWMEAMKPAWRIVQ